MVYTLYKKAIYSLHVKKVVAASAPSRENVGSDGLASSGQGRTWIASGSGSGSWLVQVTCNQHEQTEARRSDRIELNCCILGLSTINSQSEASSLEALTNLFNIQKLILCRPLPLRDPKLCKRI